MIVIRSVRRCGWQRADAERMKAGAEILGRSVRQSRCRGWKCWPAREQSLLQSQGYYFFACVRASINLFQSTRDKRHRNTSCYINFAQSFITLLSCRNSFFFLPSWVFWVLWWLFPKSFSADVGTSPHYAFLEMYFMQERLLQSTFSALKIKSHYAKWRTWSRTHVPWTLTLIQSAAEPPQGRPPPHSPPHTHTHHESQPAVSPTATH